MGLFIFLGVLFLVGGALVFNLPILAPSLVGNFDIMLFYGAGGILVFLGLVIIVVSLTDKGGKNSSENVGKSTDVVTAIVKTFKDGKGKLVDGLPPITLEVEYFYKEQFHTIDIETNEYDESVYPIGSELRLAIKGKKIRILEDD